MKQEELKILENKKVAAGFYKMRVKSAYLAKESKPGQFVEVKCSCGQKPLLRRPLGVHRAGSGWVEMLYEVVGKGTEVLSTRRRGENIDIIGPLGNGFIVNEKTGIQKNEKTVIVAGGIGAAPLLFLAEKLAGDKGSDISVLIGACTKKHLLCENEFKKTGADVNVATDDGTKGYKGFVTDLLKDLLASRKKGPATVYACGPAGMLRAVSAIADETRVSCRISLEERMACGVGVCLGCPVKTKGNEYKMVCKDGPVFNAEEIAW